MPTKAEATLKKGLSGDKTIIKYQCIDEQQFLAATGKPSLYFIPKVIKEEKGSLEIYFGNNEMGTEDFRPLAESLALEKLSKQGYNVDESRARVEYFN